MTIATWQSQEAPTEAQLTANNSPSSRVIDGVIRSGANGTEQGGGIARFNTSEMTGNPGDILSTAQNNAGSPTSNLRGDTTVELIPGNPGSRVSLAAAAAMGLVRKTAQGDYVAADQSAGLEAQLQEQSQRQQEEQQANGPELFEAAHEESFNATIADIPQGMYDQAIVKAANQVAETGNFEDFVTALSSSSGLTVEQVQAARDQGLALFQGQADATVEALGVDPQQLWDWSRSNKPQELARAVREQVTARTLEGYRSLAKEFLTKTIPADVDSKGFDIKPRGKGAGDAIVTIDGVRMEMRVAARLGLLG